MERFTRLFAPSAETAPEQVGTGTDTFRFVFSNEKVGRDGFIVLNRSIQHANYDRNNIVLWSHDDKQPPVGRGANIQIGPPGGSCRIDITFVSRDILPFAGTIRDLVAGKWLRAMSMSWQPLEHRYSDDPRHRGVIEFTKIDMLEVSVCPLPALADALLDARSFGIDTRPLRQWAERALDMPGYQAIPRPQIEAIYRACKAPSTTSAREQRMREERVRRARALKLGTPPWERTGDSMGTVSDFQARRFSAGDRGKLRGVERHLRKAVGHHDSLEDHHDTIGEHVRAARAAHRALTSTLKDLGFGERSSRATSTLAELGYDHGQVTRALGELGEALGAVTTAHRAAETTADEAHTCVREARTALVGMAGAE